MSPGTSVGRSPVPSCGDEYVQTITAVCLGVANGCVEVTGDNARAIVDYDEALAANDKIAWSHYGRGVAKLRLGQKEAGEADLAKAKALDPDLPDRAKAVGIIP